MERVYPTDLTDAQWRMIARLLTFAIIGNTAPLGKLYISRSVPCAKINNSSCQARRDRPCAHNSAI